MAELFRTVKLKSGFKKKVRVSKAFVARKKKLSSSKWTSVKISLYEKSELRSKSWFSISSTGMVYISRDPGSRTYWILSKMPKRSWPKFRWSDRNLSFSVNATRIVFKKTEEYLKAKTAFLLINPSSK